MNICLRTGCLLLETKCILQVSVSNIREKSCRNELSLLRQDARTQILNEACFCQAPYSRAFLF